jgi:hypothetical protein
MVPLAEIKTAGVIMAVNTAKDDVKASMLIKPSFIVMSRGDAAKYVEFIWGEPVPLPAKRL